MVFSSLSFLGLFVPLVWGLNRLLPAQWRNLWLLLASLWFYAWGEGVWVWLMVGSILLNYGIGLQLDRSSSRQRKSWLILAISLNLGSLFIVKYLAFFVYNINYFLIGNENAFLILPSVEITLPLGISFFTFQALSYQIDLYRQRFRAQKNPLDLGLYIALFPQLVAGPIVRYEELYQQLRDRKLNWSQNLEGVKRFVVGLAKKVLIADPLGLVVDKVFQLPETSLSPLLTWLAVIAYALQIYFDFSGYSDMAIGLGKMLGFELPENFRYPYIARSVREFWRRWHISLSTWFRDYLYIPLGGNQKRTIANLLLVFVLCGLWHGASWNFLIWGLFHGCFLVLERGMWGRLLARIPRGLQHLYTLGVVLFAWVWFRAEDTEQAWTIFSRMLGSGSYSIADSYAWFLLRYDIALPLLAGLLLSMPLFTWLQKYFVRFRFLEALVYGVLTLIALLTVLTNAYHPFIYFRF